MCGITGAVWHDKALAISASTLLAMTKSLQHRGPDDHGSYADESLRLANDRIGVALGFRRLAIIDVATGQQPIPNEDQTIWLIANGEIYNYQSLRSQLEKNGHLFRTQSDCECIVHLYEEFGLDGFKLLNGMFAFAIWDEKHKRLVLARDRLGQKPLVYHEQPGRLAFASELKALRKIPRIDLSIDPVAVDHYLTYQYVPHPRTIYREACKLPPAHLAVYENQQLTIQRYWHPNWNEETELSHLGAQQEVERTLTEAVAIRLRSDVPLGIFLSGGVDSSLLTALMAKQLDAPVKTFSIGFPVQEYDETSYARQMANHVGAEHFELQVKPDAVNVLPKLAWHYDEPFGDSSALPTWYVAKFASEHVKVALTGDGGDELFAGYPRYKAVAGAELATRLRMHGLMSSPFWQSLPGTMRKRGLVRRIKRFSASMAQDPLERYFEWITIFNDARRHALYTPEFANEVASSQPFSHIEDISANSMDRDIVTTASLIDVQSYLPCALLTKVDIASMAHGLECRQPFLDHRLVELAAALPIQWKLKWNVGKRILRDSFGSLLPKNIWTRRKLGFSVPIDHWFRDELYNMTRDMLLSDSAIQLGFFAKKSIETLLEDHRSGRADHADQLWALLMFELWRQTWG